MFQKLPSPALAIAAVLAFAGVGKAGHGHVAIYIHGGGHYHVGFAHYVGFHYGFAHYAPHWGIYGFVGPRFYSYYAFPPVAVAVARPSSTPCRRSATNRQSLQHSIRRRRCCRRSSRMPNCRRRVRSRSARKSRKPSATTAIGPLHRPLSQFRLRETSIIRQFRSCRNPRRSRSSGRRLRT